ncbi:MAG: hypothetical protein WKG06_11105 [Segetibacter sp.]
MKIYKIYIQIFALAIFIPTACSKILDKLPQDKFSNALVFSDINLADRYLLDTYNQSLIGGVGYLSFASLTDESHDTHGFETANYLQGMFHPALPARLETGHLIIRRGARCIKIFKN